VGQHECVDIHPANPSSVGQVVTQPEPLVTGDAVLLDVQIAQLPVRALAALIDLTVVAIGYVVGVLLWALAISDLDDALSAAVLVIFTVLTIVGYPTIVEVATRGRSLGKMALGLRVVSDDGGQERFRQALFRALSGFVELWMFAGGPAVICSMANGRGKRIGDVFAGTMVISQRGPKLTAPVPMPPQLAWWASSLQLSGLRPQQAELARQFLSRASQLEPVVRDQMAYRIYAEVIAQISPPPPANAPPPVVLAAVLAERHRRELARLRPAGPPPGYPPAYPPPQFAPPQFAPQPFAPPPFPPPQAQVPPPGPGGFTLPD
jgi:uncharacterized RDD family membrane protein YckC